MSQRRRRSVFRNDETTGWLKVSAPTLFSLRFAELAVRWHNMADLLSVGAAGEHSVNSSHSRGYVSYIPRIGKV